MPIRNERVYCITHQDTELKGTKDFFALTKVTISEGNVTFAMGQGLPCKAVYCPKCGYVELYWAEKIDEWKQAMIKPSSSSKSSSIPTSPD